MKTILRANVTAKKIKFDNGIAWQVGQEKFKYGWALIKATDGRFFDCLYTPEGIELVGDIIKISSGRGGIDICFQPHGGQVTRKQADTWYREHHMKFSKDDKHHYGDVHSVTYRNPTSKTGRLRTDPCYGISIQHEVNVIVVRKNGKRPTMSIPIDSVVERHLYTYDASGNRVEKNPLEIIEKWKCRER